jgi:queuine tRNA-ribosyltransferase
MTSNHNSFPVFHVVHTEKNGRARTGKIVTKHGTVHTPSFLFCATKATLKGVPIQCIVQEKTEILLSNTYHLMLQPGSKVIEDMGGLASFMGWNGPTFTDSGGYQIFSLHHGCVSDEIKGKKRHMHNVPPVRINEDGALFVSHRDGAKHLLTPEKSIQVQCQLGADMICVLDECTPLHMTKQQTKNSLDLSHRWAVRSLNTFNAQKKAHQGLYGIVQGGVYPEFRHHSAAFIASQPFFGHAIGGSLGSSKEQMDAVVSMALDDHLLDKKPIHLLGIGGVRDIFAGVRKGIDTFDCVAPTRLGRHGGALIQPHYWNTAKEAFHGRENINLHKACFRDDALPIDEECPCQTCRHYSRAYIHHLLKSKELLAMTALTIHNISFMNRMMADIRASIGQNQFNTCMKRWIS